MNPHESSILGLPNSSKLQPLSHEFLDLTRQQRNLLLMRPLFSLELNKGLRSDAEGSLFHGIDTHYLALSALDVMMEGTTVSTGVTSEEVLQHLRKVAARMNSSLSKIQQDRIADAVLGALDNKSMGHKEFAFDYYDAPKGKTVTVKFRLVAFEPDMEDVFRYKPTPEGYLVYLGMLDLSLEDSQELMEKMLDLLVQRGRFDAALEIARRARALSIEYRQMIRDRLHQSYRAPGSVNWTLEVSPRLDQARAHIHQRQVEDQRMEESVRESLKLAEEPGSRVSLAALLQALTSSGLLRSELVNDISGANDRFLLAQRSVFRARRATGLPDLESSLLPQLMAVPTQALAEDADGIVSVLYPSTWPKVYDLNIVFEILLERRSEEVEPDVDDGDIMPYQVIAPQFSEETISAVSAWLSRKFATGEDYRLDQLLELADEEGLDRMMRRCLVLVLFRSFADSETEFKHMQSQMLERFVCDVAQGTNLLFSPKKAQP